MTGAGGECGFSLVEVLLATALTVVVTALACAFAVDAQAMWSVESARVDLHQRARVASDLLMRALLEAGTGPHGGAGRGSLLRRLAPVLPRRVGARDADRPDQFRTDAFTVIRATPETEPGVLLLPLPAGGSTIELAPTCALPACGFSAGTSIIVFDSTGTYDLFTVRSVQGLTLDVRHQGDGTSAGYAEGAPVLSGQSTTFYLDARAHILRTYDGDASDLPLMDDVVGMSVQYFGEGSPPTSPRPAAGQANCLYDGEGTYLSALLPVIPGAPAFAPLGPGLVTDGPWCGAGGNQFDADLLRVRRVRVVVRVQASDSSVRGLDPDRFAVPGTATSRGRMVPDVIVAVDVGPRNLVQGW
jgi:hypothetical protein